MTRSRRPPTHLEPSAEAEFLQDAAALGLDPRIVAALHGRDVIHWIRQSSERQKQRNLGSYSVQLAQINHLQRYGLDADHPRVTLIDARGESGRRKQRADGTLTEREQFEELMTRLETGRYGVLVVFNLNRVGRNEEDNGRFLGVIQRLNILVIENGKVLNPQDRGDRLQAGVRLQIAAFMGDEEAEKLQQSRFDRANALKLRTTLPTGLVHADPTDPTFRARMSELGLQDRITPEALATHRLVTVLEEAAYYVLPHPHPVIWRCTQILLQLVRECGSVAQVVRRVNAGVPGWPDGWQGFIPTTKQCIWRHNIPVRMQRVTKAGLRRWLSSPALYGHFAFSAPALQKRHAMKPPGAFDIDREGAYPGIVTREEWEEIQEILRRPGKKSRPEQSQWRAFPGARRFALPAVYCEETAPDREGGVCGRKIGPLYWPDGSYFYRSIQCHTDAGHTYSFSPVIDSVALEVLEQTFDRDMLRRGLARIQLRRVDVESELRELRKREATLSSLKAEARRAATMAGADQQFKLQAELQQDYRDYDQQLTDVQTRLKGVEQATADGARLQDEDVRRIMALAEDLPAMLHAAQEADRLVDAALHRAHAAGDEAEVLRLRTYEGLVRQVVAATKITVHLARGEGGAVRLAVGFPSGQRVVCTVDAAYAGGSQAERLWAHRRLGVDGATPEMVAAELVAASPTEPASTGRLTGAPWDASTIRAAVAYHERCEHVPALESGGRTVDAIATEVGAERAAVLAEAMRGRLGRARFDERGQFLLEASAPQLHAAFPEHARRSVAASKGWPVEDVASISELRRHFVIGSHNIATRNAELGAGLASDAAGALYTRRSQFVATDADLLRRKLTEPAYEKYAHLDARYWVRMADARTRLPGVDGKVIQKMCPTVPIGRGKRKTSLNYVWLTPEHIARLEHVPLEIAVERLVERSGNAYAPADFLPREEVLERLRANGVGISAATLSKFRKAGLVVTVAAAVRKRRNVFKLQYVYLPAGVRATTDRTVVERWLRGEYLPAPAAKQVSSDASLAA